MIPSKRMLAPTLCICFCILLSGCGDDGSNGDDDMVAQDTTEVTGDDMTDTEPDTAMDADTDEEDMAPTAGAEPYEAFVGPGAEGPWESLGTGEGPETFTVPAATNGAFTHVRILDQTTDLDSVDGGSDIDAVVVTPSAGGDAFYADSVASFDFGPGEAIELDPQNALGAPDAYDAYPDLSTCTLEGVFVSLGGSPGGELILQLEAELAEGDTIQILEVGDCQF